MKHLTLTLPLLLLAMIAGQATDKKPNIVYIMSDELAYYELSHMGNPYIKTPNIDQFAREGIRFTQALAGSPVCAPLRCNLMTGKHAGHASVRANDGGTPLRAGEPTIASVLKDVGYATGGFGKWGCGGRDSTGVPEKHGFDIFFGYYDQVHAHSFYPPYLIRNSEEVPLKGNVGGRSGETHAQYPIMEEALKFIRENKDKPFFCYLPITPPHGMFDIPKEDPAWRRYKGEKWIEDEKIPQDVKNYAAMVTMVDDNLGQVLELLRKLKLEDDTIVFFTGDNGGQDRFRSKEHPRGFFGPNVNPRTKVEFRGGKGSLYEGGLRIPYLVRWPGRIKAGQVSDLIFYQPDVLPTLAELCKAKTPDDVDGISILPTLLGEKAVGHKQKEREMLYWEFGNQTAVRRGHWKAIQPGKNRPWELYDLNKDVSETTSVADGNPKVLAKMKAFAEREHEPVQSGTFTTRERHERDRQAKWGSTRRQADNHGKKMNRLKDKNLIPLKETKLVRFSSENFGNDRRAAYAIDGSPRTVWHTQFSPKLHKHPHELVIDLGSKRKVSGFHYLTRQDGGWNGSFGRTQFFLSDSPKEFGEPVLETTFAKVKAPQAADLKKPIEGRYVLIRVLDEINGNPWASAADIGVIAKPIK